MLAFLPVEKHVPTDDLAAGASSASFTGMALEISGRKTPASGRAPMRKGRRDFVEALQVLGAKSKLYRLGAGDALPRTIALHISCPYRTWVRVFGKPRQLEKYGKTPGKIAIHLWQHECEDGPVTCIGQVSERLPGLRWVVLMRVGLYG
jgi:hypothetical protein